jgi:hypothetical protein
MSRPRYQARGSLHFCIKRPRLYFSNVSRPQSNGRLRAILKARATKVLLLFLLCFCTPSRVFSKPQEADLISVSKGAFAANAGGQEAYSMRYLHNMIEFQIFANKSLTVGGQPLVGAGFGPRFNGCEECFWKPFIQTDAGFSNAGPFVELDWGITIPLLPIWLPVDPPKYVLNCV